MIVRANDVEVEGKEARTVRRKNLEAKTPTSRRNRGSGAEVLELVRALVSDDVPAEWEAGGTNEREQDKRGHRGGKEGMGLDKIGEGL